MESQHSLTKNIVSTTIKIQEEYPELTKYIDETPFHSQSINHGEINCKDLKSYYNTLNELLESYAKALKC